MPIYTNPQGLPDALLRAAASILDDYDAGDAKFTVTQLNDPPRVAYLKRKHDHQIVVDIANKVYAVEGSSFHHMMERSERMGLKEERLYTEFEGTRISGKYDLCVLQHRVLQDWKRCSVYTYFGGPKVEWIAQLNLLHLLAVDNGYEIDELEVVPVYRDWMKSRARIDKKYPQTQCLRVPIPVWPRAEQEAYLRSRIELHTMTLETGCPPECTNAERWVKDEGWAVMVPGLKRAKGVYKDREDAEVLQATLAARKATIEHRPGVATRCIDWCDAAPFCDQWQRELASVSTSTEERGEPAELE